MGGFWGLLTVAATAGEMDGGGVDGNGGRS